MAAPFDVVAVIGSLRRESFTRRVVTALAALAPAAAMRIRVVEIGDLPLYNQDLETATPPEAWRTFRDSVKKADAVLFATPEYNRSVPGVLKNAIDVGSRPYGSSAWDRKPAAVVSCSPGAIGGMGANHDLRKSLVFLDMPALQMPEFYLGGVDKAVDASGKVLDPEKEKFFVKFLTAFEEWIARQTMRRL